MRDGAQRGDLFLGQDKLRIAARLDDLGIAYIEGGWPGSNPKDAEFFARAAQMHWQHARIAAFGSTRHADSRVEQDPNVRALLECGAPVAVLVGKASTMQVTQVLRTTLDENLAMIGDTVAYLRPRGAL